MSSRAINSLIIIICLIKLFARLSMGVTQISQWKKTVILEELGKCCLIAFLNNASPDKLINQIVLYLKCSYCEPNLSSPNKKGSCVGRGVLPQTELFHWFVLDSFSLFGNKDVWVQSFWYLNELLLGLQMQQGMFLLQIKITSCLAWDEKKVNCGHMVQNFN